jgi:hypothetical protein
VGGVGTGGGATVGAGVGSTRPVHPHSNVRVFRSAHVAVSNSPACPATCESPHVTDGLIPVRNAIGLVTAPPVGQMLHTGNNDCVAGIKG